MAAQHRDMGPEIFSLPRWPPSASTWLKFFPPQMAAEHKEMVKKQRAIETGNAALRQELAGLLRENEKLAMEVETMHEQMSELLRVYGQHRNDAESVREMSCDYRREINTERKNRDDVLMQLRTHETAKNVLDRRVEDAARWEGVVQRDDAGRRRSASLLVRQVVVVGILTSM